MEHRNQDHIAGEVPEVLDRRAKKQISALFAAALVVIAVELVIMSTAAADVFPDTVNPHFQLTTHAHVMNTVRSAEYGVEEVVLLDNGNVFVENRSDDATAPEWRYVTTIDDKTVGKYSEMSVQESYDCLMKAIEQAEG